MQVAAIVSVILPDAYRHYRGTIATDCIRKMTLNYYGGTILNRTCGTDKNLYISLFLLTRFGPIYYGPPE